MSSVPEFARLSKAFIENQERATVAYRNLLQSFSSSEILIETDYPEFYGGAYIE
jgi:hypothetical protein